MTEYISREEAIKELREVYENEYPTASGDFDEYASHDMPNVLRNIPAADVQPTNRWISVDEALPIYDGLVLAVDKNNTIRLGIYTDLGWTSQFGNSMVTHITHWQPLPEPPNEVPAFQWIKIGNKWCKTEKELFTRNLTDEETDIYNSWLEAEAETIDEI